MLNMEQNLESPQLTAFDVVCFSSRADSSPSTGAMETWPRRNSIC